MYKLFFISILSLFMIISIVSCSDDDGNTILDPPNIMIDTVELPYGVAMAIENTDIELTMYGVTDVRCPSFALCVWEGMVEASVRVVIGSDTSHILLPMFGATVTSDTNDYMPVEESGYTFTLNTLSPYRDIDCDCDSLYVATVLISNETVPDRADGTIELTNRQPELLYLEDYFLDSLWVDDDRLNIDVLHSGGCRPHYYWAFASPDSLTSKDAAEAEIYLRHFSFEDPCDAFVPQSLSFDISDLVAKYKSQFGGDGAIQFNVHDDAGDIDVWKIAWFPKNWQREEILPMAIGNYWVYADSVWDTDHFIGSIDSVMVRGQFTDSTGSKWWTLTGSLFDLNDSIMIRNDSIFDYQHGAVYDFASLFYIPSKDTLSTYGVLIGDIMSDRTVQLESNIISTPVGRWLGTYSYYSDQITPYTHSWIVPGIGFIKMEERYFDYDAAQITHKKILLRTNVID